MVTKYAESFVLLSGRLQNGYLLPVHTFQRFLKKGKILVFVNFMNILEKNQLEEKTVLTIKRLMQVATHLVSQKMVLAVRIFVLICVCLKCWLVDLMISYH